MTLHFRSVCTAGYSEDQNGNCIECGVGTYRSGPGNRPCDLCGNFETTNGMGFVDESACGEIYSSYFQLSPMWVGNAFIVSVCLRFSVWATTI